MSIEITDLFCGAGGSSIGGELAGGRLRLALNHWKRAIETHATNFQDADHDCNDVSALSTAQIRRYPHTDVLLASPECTNHSLAKGAKRRPPKAASLWEDGPAGDEEAERSRATMWDVCRFAEQALLKGHPYKAIVVENVTEAFWWGPPKRGYKQGDGTLFDAWLQALGALGYRHQVVWLNSMFAGGLQDSRAVPQSRDRLYVVFWRKGIREPNLRIEPLSWCPACQTLVEGRQTFKVGSLKKSGGRPWGSYGRQYFYTCPDCADTVYPGAVPAAAVIDWSLPIGRIGDRDKPLELSTRKRVKRGLEKTLNEPFALRTGGTGNPRPLTLPLITLTTRREMGMVIPVAANTHERTPGTRARNSEKRPLGTVHGAPDRALVLAPMGQAAAQKAESRPAPTQTTSTRPALVMANTENCVPRPAEWFPAQTLRTQGGLALAVEGGDHEEPTLAGPQIAAVMRNNNGGGEMSTPAHEPIRTLTAGCHQSILVPYHRTGNAVSARQGPSPTLTSRDRVALVIPYTRDARPRDAGLETTPTMTAEGPPALAITEADVDQCGFRMFALSEIAAAMAMSDHVDGSPYEVLGNKRERMAQYGNAVTPPVMEFLVGRLLEVIA